MAHTAQLQAKIDGKKAGVIACKEVMAYKKEAVTYRIPERVDGNLLRPKECSKQIRCYQI